MGDDRLARGAAQPISSPCGTAIFLRQRWRVPRMKKSIKILCGFFAVGLALAQEPSYQPAPKSLQPFFEAKPVPRVSLSPDGRYMVLVQGVRFQRIEDLSRPYLGLAGVRINPLNNGPANPIYYTDFKLLRMSPKREDDLQMPAGQQRFSLPRWSPDGKRFAFLRYRSRDVELWLGNAERRQIKQVTNIRINAAFGGRVFQWMPDSKNILCQVIPARRGKLPQRERVASGPVIDDTKPGPTPLRPTADGLKDEFDQKLFVHYCQSDLALVDVDSNQRKLLRRQGGQRKPSVFINFDVSPEGKYILVERVHPPFRLHTPATNFPRSVEVWDLKGDLKNFSLLPSTDTTQVGGVPRHPRLHHWRPTSPDTLAWVEALDGGQPSAEVTHRDRVMTKPMSGDTNATELVRLEHRYSGIYWGEDSDVVIVREYQSSMGRHHLHLVNPGEPSVKSPVFAPQEPDALSPTHPGHPMMRQLPSGKRAMRVDQGAIFLNGLGATPQGDYPFLDRFQLETRQRTRLFQCGEQGLEYVVALMDNNASRFITRYERPDLYPNYYIRESGKTGYDRITNFRDRAPKLQEIVKKRIKYRRGEDEFDCMLYLPPGYDMENPKRLPTILWVYPVKFTQSRRAAFLAGDSRRFNKFLGADSRLLALEGYAVLDLVPPIVGDQQTANDTFIEQLVDSAGSAIDQVTVEGYCDPQRVGVAGHSYGAFAAVMLLAHSKFFLAGMAQSGAYNRTLTPNGFQNERRNLWEAFRTYRKMSPFFDVPKIQVPLLLIHGLEDSNAATPPEQSRRLFQAIKATGGKARLVELPHESHTYRTRESIEHSLYEMVEWFDKHVKNWKAEPLTPSPGTSATVPLPPGNR